MKTVLRDGDLIQFRYHGRLDFGRVVSGGTAYELLPSDYKPEAGTEYYSCIWKRGKGQDQEDELIPRVRRIAR